MAEITEQQMLQFLKSKGYAQPNYGVLGALGGAYGAFTGGNAMSDAYSAQAEAAAQQAQMLQQQQTQMPTLASLYGQDSPYAQAMKQSLAAKDAAAGRNSQYGQREVQLQAALADKASSYGSAQAQMASQYSQAQAQAQQAQAQAALGQQQVRAQQLGSLFNLADKSGYLQKANTGLQSLYNQYFPDAPSDAGPMMSTPQTSMQDRQGYDIPWGISSEQTDYMPAYQSNGGMGQMYAPDTNYSFGMDYSQAPTSSDNSYYQPDWME